MSTSFSRFYFINLTSISNASPAVFTLVDHGLQEGDIIRLETTGTLPSPFAVKTNYYVVYNGLTTSTFQLASEDEGDPINSTTAGSGTHSYIKRTRASLSPRVEDCK
jgi:hypothetical protein